MSQGLQSGSFCSGVAIVRPRGIWEREHVIVWRFASSSEHAFVNLLRGCECLGSLTFLCFLMQICSCFGVSRAFKLFTARLKATNSFSIKLSFERHGNYFIRNEFLHNTDVIHELG